MERVICEEISQNELIRLTSGQILREILKMKQKD